MANTKEIRTKIEPFICDWLATQYKGFTFSEKKVKLPTSGTYNFDAVSQDGRIVGAVLSNRARTRTGRENTGGVRKATQDLSYLKLLPSRVTKLMIFTDNDFCELIKRRALRQGIEDIQFIFCKLPNDLNLLLNRILDEASREQRAAE
jgi:hypothetical protein